MAAIYGFLKSLIEPEYLLSTILYPVDIDDSLILEVTISGGTMVPLPAAEVSGTFGAENGTLVQLRWFYSDGPYDSEVSGTFGAENGALVQLRWFYSDGPYDSEVSGTFGVGPGGSLIKLVVIGDTPDELLQIAITINDTCTMDLI